MNSKPLETKQNQAVNDELELVLNTDEIEQLAKFLDALLEADLSSHEYEGNGNDWYSKARHTLSRTSRMAYNNEKENST